MDILLDTNILLAPGRYKADIFGLLAGRGLAPATLSSVVVELEELAKRKGRDAACARLALTLLKRHALTIIPSAGPADRELLRTAERTGAAVCTMDRKLLLLLKKKKMPALTISKNSLKSFVPAE